MRERQVVSYHQQLSPNAPPCLESASYSTPPSLALFLPLFLPSTLTFCPRSFTTSALERLDEKVSGCEGKEFNEDRHRMSKRPKKVCSHLSRIASDIV